MFVVIHKVAPLFEPEQTYGTDEIGVDWLHTILNEFLTDERIPGDLKESEIVTIYKQKGDALECLSLIHI